MIQLAGAVIPAANQSFDFSGVRIEDDHGRLHLRNGLVAALFLGFAFPLVVTLCEQNVDVFRAGIDRRYRRPLQRRINRRVHAKVLTQQLVFRKFIEQVVLYHVHKVGSFVAGDRRSNNLQRRALGLLHIFFGDVFVVEHLRQHAVPGLDAALGMTVSRGVVIRCSNNAGQERALAQAELAQILSEIADAGLGKSADAKAAAIAEVDFVRVHLENLFLVEALLEFEREHGFGDLATPIAIG